MICFELGDVVDRMQKLGIVIGCLTLYGTLGTLRYMYLM